MSLSLQQLLFYLVCQYVQNYTARLRTNLIRKVLLCMILEIAAIPITTTTPYQKYLAKAFPSIWNSVSSRILPKKSIACVSFEKSTPVSFKGTEEEWPPMSMPGMFMSIFFLRGMRFRSGMCGTRKREPRCITGIKKE